MFGSKVNKFRVGLGDGSFISYQDAIAGWRGAVTSLAGPALQFAYGAALLALAWLMIHWPGFIVHARGLLIIDGPMALAAAFTGFSGFIAALLAPTAGQHDLIHAVMRMGREKLGAELSWRGKQRFYLFGVYGALFELLWREHLGRRPPRRPDTAASIGRDP